MYTANNHIGEKFVTFKQRKLDMNIPHSFKKECTLKSTVHNKFFFTS